MEYEKFKIVVAGDSGVGKTALVHLLCHNQPLPNPAYTVGCSLNVKLYPFRNNELSDQRLCFLEFWDIGGSNSHANTRSVFYQNIHGLILVYDCTNSKSQVNLRKWLAEIQQKTPSNSLEAINVACVPSNSYRVTNLFSRFTSNDLGFASQSVGDSVDFNGRVLDGNSRSVPILIVGTKVDLLDATSRRKITAQYSSPPQPMPAGNQNNWGSNEHRSKLLFEVPEMVAPLTDSVHVTLDSRLPSLSWSLSQSFGGTGNFAVEQGLPEVMLDCNSLTFITRGCYNFLVLEAFFNDVIHTKLSTGGQSPYLGRQPWQTNRTRFAIPGGMPFDNGHKSEAFVPETWPLRRS